MRRLPLLALAAVLVLGVAGDGVLHIGAADAIWTTEQPHETEPEPSAWRTWIAVIAFAVLIGGLGARFLAGRRLRNERLSPDVDDPEG